MLVGAAAAAAAPTANADDPNLPVAGSESARQTLNGITARTEVPGYSPGVPDVPLSQCTVRPSMALTQPTGSATYT